MSALPGMEVKLGICLLTLEILRCHLEGILSVWLQFNDGTAAPLDIFNPADYMFSVKSLEPTFVTSEAIDGQVGSPWPRLIAGSKEGGVSLLHVTLGICNVCRKLKRKSMVSSTTVNVTVVFENKTVGQIITSVASSNSTAFVNLEQHNNHAIGAQNGVGNDSEGSGRTDVELQKKIHDGHKLPAKVKDTSTPILDDEHSKPGVTGTNSEDRDLTSVPPHGLSNLHIGMYVLLSVFCFAILLFLANCIAFAVRSRRKPPTRGQDELLNPRPHDWLELAGTPPIEGEGKGCTMASGGTSHGTSGGRNNSSKSGRWPMSRASSSMTRRPGETLQARTEIGTRSPVSQRKQVKFSIFADTHSPQRPGRGHPGRERDIEWICLDTGFREAEGLSRYIHSMVDSS